MIDQARLKQLLDYDPETGEFRWRADVKHMYAGRVAGTEFKSTNAQTKYLRIKVDSVTYMAHRLAWLWANGSMPSDDIDHINGDGLDNRLSNIRVVTRNENLRNMPKQKSNTSGLTGIHWRARTQRWIAQINKKPGRRMHLYCGPDLFEAVCIRKSAELKLGYHANHGR